MYTANIGGYDLYRTDIKCFTERPGKRNALDAKIYKVLPHLFLDTDWSIWVDSSVFLRVDPKELLDQLGDKDIGVFPHPQRNCIYAEAQVCKQKGLDDPYVIDAQMSRYRKAGYPPKSGLAMGGIIVRKHTDKVKRLCEQWWKEIWNGSTRDQLSFPYVFQGEIKYFPTPAATSAKRRKRKVDAPYFIQELHNELTVVCFWWGDWGERNGQQYVERLYQMFSRHLHVPHSFVCFTDRYRLPVHRKGIEYRPLPDYVIEWGGNLPKFFVYSSDSGLTGRVVMCDLDSVIVGRLDDMLSYDGEWCGIRAINPRKHHIGGGLVSFEHSKCKWIWETIRMNPKKWFHISEGGRERMVYKRLLPGADCWQDLYPGQLVSYKRHLRDRGKLDTKRVRFVAFHGRPRPHQVDEDWIKEHWK